MLDVRWQITNEARCAKLDFISHLITLRAVSYEQAREREIAPVGPPVVVYHLISNQPRSQGLSS